MNVLSTAFDYATEAHRDQYRRSGEAYIEHPLKVALKLKEFKLENEIIAVSLLHDVCEESNITPVEISDKFGKKIGMMVYFLTKEKKDLLSECSKKRLLLYLEKIKQGTLIYPEIVLIKMADQFDNLNSINTFPIQKQKQQIEEMKLYFKLYSEMFKYIPQNYYPVLQKLSKELQGLVWKIEQGFL